MIRGNGIGRRTLLMPAVLVCLILAGAAPATAYTPPGDKETGQHAHYDFVDYATTSHDGRIDCTYRSLSSGSLRLKSFRVRPPRAWWYDTNSDTTHEHGTVGWRFRIQQTTDPDDDPWTTIYSSSIQKRTAHEDHPGYSDGDKASFTTRSKSWSSSKTVYFRIKVTVYWYRSSGSVKGSVDHWYNLYDPSYGGGPAFGYCRNKVPVS